MAERTNHPASPTEIYRNLQAQAWALLPELANDLNKRSSSEVAVDKSAINPLLQCACNEPSDACLQSQNKEIHEGTGIEEQLLHYRIPASQKGKEVQGEGSTHGGQATDSFALATTSAAPGKAVHRDSTRLEEHQLHISISEEGWEPAKLHRRKRPDPEPRTVQTSNRPRDKSWGSTFFRSKMEGRCFNCLSPKHLAHLYRSPPRYWKCYHSGH